MHLRFLEIRKKEDVEGFTFFEFRSEKLANLLHYFVFIRALHAGKTKRRPWRGRIGIPGKSKICLFDRVVRVK